MGVWTRPDVESEDYRTARVLIGRSRENRAPAGGLRRHFGEAQPLGSDLETTGTDDCSVTIEDISVRACLEGQNVTQDRPSIVDAEDVRRVLLDLLHGHLLRRAGASRAVPIGMRGELLTLHGDCRTTKAKRIAPGGMRWTRSTTTMPTKCRPATSHARRRRRLCRARCGRWSCSARSG